MWYLVVISIAVVAVIAGVGYYIISRSTGNSLQSFYWLNRNKHNGKLIELQTNIKQEEEDFKIVKKVIGSVVNFRNLLKRVILELEAIEHLLNKSSRIMRSEFDEIALLYKNMLTLKNELNDTIPKLKQTDPDLKEYIGTLQKEVSQTNRNIEIILDPNTEISVLIATIKNSLGILKTSYDNIVQLHTRFIEYYHDSFSISL